MRSKGPENVFLTADFPQAEAAGINILQSPDFSRSDHFLQPDDCRMVIQNMTDKQNPALIRGQPNQFFTVGMVQGQGLLHKNMLSGLQGFFSKAKVMNSRRGNDDALDVLIFHDSVNIAGNGNIRIGFGHFFANTRCSVADRFENA